MRNAYWLQDINGVFHVRFKIDGSVVSASTKQKSFIAADKEVSRVIANIKNKLKEDKNRTNPIKGEKNG